MTLYGVVGALFSYCVSLVVASPLAAFALSAGYQAVMFLVSSDNSWGDRTQHIDHGFDLVIPCCILAHDHVRRGTLDQS